MDILKRLFCKHIYKYSRTGIITHTESDFSGDGCYNSWQERYTEYICIKCGKRKKVFNICDITEQDNWELYEPVRQKSVEWNKEDEEMIIKICQNLHDYPHIKSPFDDESFNEALKEVQFIKSLKDRIQPKVEWSKDDEYYYGIIQYILNNECVGKTDKENAINWFKSFKERYTWKPSDEQIELLQAIVSNPNNASLEGCQMALKDIIKQLKKLREE